MALAATETCLHYLNFSAALSTDWLKFKVLPCQKSTFEVGSVYQSPYYL
jgi:hypothetical protein